MKPGDVVEVERYCPDLQGRWDFRWIAVAIDYADSQEIGVTFADGMRISVNRHGDRWRELSDV